MEWRPPQIEYVKPRPAAHLVYVMRRWVLFGPWRAHCTTCGWRSLYRSTWDEARRAAIAHRLGML